MLVLCLYLGSISILVKLSANICSYIGNSVNKYSECVQSVEISLKESKLGSGNYFIIFPNGHKILHIPADHMDTTVHEQCK